MTLELPGFIEQIDQRLTVAAQCNANAGFLQGIGRNNAISRVSLRGTAGADSGLGLAEQGDFMGFDVYGVHCRKGRAEQTERSQGLERPLPMLPKAIGD